MNKTVGIIVAIVAIVIIGGGAYWYMNNKASPSAPATTSQSSSNNVSNNNNVANSTNDKEQIISAILTMQDIMASKDATAIRNYLNTYSNDPGMKASLAKASDKSVVDIAGLISDSPVTADQLRDPSTTYQIGDTQAVVTVKIDNGTKSITVNKVGGVWH